MVMDYGMSRLGRVTFRENNHSTFLAGGGEDRLHSHSEETAREIDREVKRIIDEALEKVRAILQTRRAALVALAERLMDVESIQADELQSIVEQHSPGPRVVPGTEVCQKRTTPPDGAKSVDDGAVEMGG
jgi:cell division protease FtsH